MDEWKKIDSSIIGKIRNKELTTSQYLNKFERRYEDLKQKGIPQAKIEKVEQKQEVNRVGKEVPQRTSTESTRSIEKRETIRKVDKAKEYHRNQTTKKSTASKEVPKSTEKVSPRNRTVNPSKKTPVKRKTS
ncbi:MAG: hypothetical protein KDC53_24375 [Saprospiraceae bacterium]|nr:hypothetical protein [Saprospiraceae bacterium]